MANCRARCVGVDRTREKETSRLGSESAYTEAATWRTFARANVDKSGRGFIEVVRDGKVLHHYQFPEEKED